MRTRYLGPVVEVKPQGVCGVYVVQFLPRVRRGRTRFGREGGEKERNNNCGVRGSDGSVVEPHSGY